MIDKVDVEPVRSKIEESKDSMKFFVYLEEAEF
jgi:hypothetical protein